MRQADQKSKKHQSSPKVCQTLKLSIYAGNHCDQRNSAQIIFKNPMDKFFQFINILIPGTQIGNVH
jgi:hypothetical protein